MKTITDHIVDILQNSTRAGATEVKLNISILPESGFMVFEVADNGRGIPQYMADSVADPFTTTRKTRRVGLGLPLLRQHALMSGGSLEISSEEGTGTIVIASFGLGSIDRQPLGNLGEAVALFITGTPGVNLVFSYSSPEGSFAVSSKEISDSLDGDDMGRPVWFGIIREMITDNLHQLGAASI
ncbi:MAG: ATP-binding protein [Bacteroidales bacterium]